MGKVETTTAERLDDSISNKKIETGKNAAQQAKEIGVAASTLSDLRLGKLREPSSLTMKKICAYYGVSEDYLHGLSNTKSTDKQIAALMDETGLSEESVERLKGLSYRFTPQLDFLLRSDYLPRFFKLMETYKLATQSKTLHEFLDIPAYIRRVFPDPTKEETEDATEQLFSYFAEKYALAWLTEYAKQEQEKEDAV